MRGTTDTAAAIEYVVDRIFQPEFGDRPSVPNYAIIITDGGSNDKERTFRVSVRACRQVCTTRRTVSNMYFENGENVTEKL